MLANANREREHDTMFARTACVRLSAPTGLEPPKDFQQMRRAAMALIFDWRDSAECYDALYREIDARRRSASAAS
jgi:glycogen synthase